MLKHERDAEAVLRGKVDLILDGIKSLDPKRIRDPKLKRIARALKDVGVDYYDPYMVMVKPGPDTYPDTYPETYAVMVRPGPDKKKNPSKIKRPIPRAVKRG